MAFDHHKLWWPPATNILYVTLQMLWSLTITNCSHLWSLYRPYNYQEMVTIYTLSDDMSLLVRIPLNQHVVRRDAAHLQFWLLDMLGMFSNVVSRPWVAAVWASNTSGGSCSSINSTAAAAVEGAGAAAGLAGLLTTAVISSSNDP